MAFDPLKNRVCIIGDINPFKLVKAITKRGKNAELVFYDKEPMGELAGENHHMKGQKKPKANENHNSHHPPGVR